MEIDSSTVSNFAGEEVGANWTDKIMSMKSNERETTPADDNNDDEWVFIYQELPYLGNGHLTSMRWMDVKQPTIYQSRGGGLCFFFF